MTPPSRRSVILRRPLDVATSGWLPAVLVALLTAFLLHRAAEVSVRDVIAFVGYLVGWIILPGTLAWRLVDRRGRRPLGEDLAVGALVGYVLEFPAYLACLAVGTPHLYLAWPAVAVVATVATRRKGVWHLGTAERQHWAWSWSMAALMSYVVLWFGHYLWAVSPTRGPSLDYPYVDEPFHLALATGLRHHFPPVVTYVDDTPLDYHWLSHLHVAAASWVTGTESIVLLRAVAIPVLMIVVAYATARVAMRLTGAAWTGPAVLVGLLVAPAFFSGWSNGAHESLLSQRLVLSPSAGFVNASLLLGMLLCIEILQRRQSGWPAWLLTALSFVAMLGAKSTSLPTLIAGLVAAAAVASIIARRVERRLAALAALSIVCFLAAKPLFFGSGAHGLVIDPLALTSTEGTKFPSVLDSAGHMPMVVSILVALTYLGYLTLGGGLLALLARGGWRRPDGVFIVVTCLAGVGAALTFHQSSYSEYYFLYVVMLPLLLGAVLGLHHLFAQVPGRVVAVVSGVAFAIGAVGALLYGLATHPTNPDTASGSPTSEAVRIFLLPLLVLVALAVLLTLALLAVWPRILGARATSRGLVLPTIVLVAAGLGSSTGLRSIGAIADDPIPPTPAFHGRPLIAPGGITAARWLRAHSGVDDLIATNAHCQLPAPASACVPRNFWMAAYSERQFLVEGWSYVSRTSVGMSMPADENTTTGPFWDPTRLRDNDAAFTTPSPRSLRVLEGYGVKWLLVDARFPWNRHALLEQAHREFRAGRYIVFSLR